MTGLCAELRIASLNVERCTVKAPFDGTVVQLLVNAFESVDLRRNLIEIVSSSALEVEIIAPADWLKRVSKGQTAKMDIDELGVTGDIEILALGGAVDPVSQTVVIREIYNASKRYFAWHERRGSTMIDDKAADLGKLLTLEQEVRHAENLTALTTFYMQSQPRYRGLHTSRFGGKRRKRANSCYRIF